MSITEFKELSERITEWYLLESDRPGSAQKAAKARELLSQGCEWDLIEFELFRSPGDDYYRQMAEKAMSAHITTFGDLVRFMKYRDQ